MAKAILCIRATTYTPVVAIHMTNSIENWINTDKKLNDLLMEIESTGKSNSEMAEMAFEKLCLLYQIPRMPNDIPEDENEDLDDENEEFTEKRSLFEEHALMKYLSDENDDPRGIVLSAAWHLLNDYRVDLVQVAVKEFGYDFPDHCQIGLKGEGFYGEVVFPQKEGKSWFEMGCIKNNILE